MRISTANLQQRVLRDLQLGLAQLDQARESASSGKRVLRASDDPVATAQILRTDRDLRAIDQYQRTIGSVRTRLDTEEAVLDQVTDILSRARELAVAQGTASATAESRTITALEVDRLLEQVVALGNTRVGNEFLFAGTATGTAPMQAGGVYVGDTTTRRAEIGAGVLVPLPHHGQELFITSGTVAGLTALRDALNANDQPAIMAAIGGLDSAFDRTQGFVADIGARTRQLDSMAVSHESTSANVLLQRSGVQDVSLEEVTIRMVGLQTTIQAALLAANRVLTTSLADRL